jgi:GMP synthase PP-ATPase subunit
MKMFKDHLHLPVTCIDDSVRLLGKLKGVTDPEKKRKCIGRGCVQVVLYACLFRLVSIAWSVSEYVF